MGFGHRHQNTGPERSLEMGTGEPRTSKDKHSCKDCGLEVNNAAAGAHGAHNCLKALDAKWEEMFNKQKINI